MESELCYIDKRLCTGARFSFCDECKRAQKENSDEIQRAKTPAEVTAAHIPYSANKRQANQPECYRANQDVYPLCVGRDDKDCEHCCLYEDMPGPYDGM